MFKIDFDFGIALYLGLIIFLIFIFWIKSEKKEGRPSSKYEEKEFIWQCEICAYTYVDSTHASISQCPRCGSYNERKDKG